MNVERTVRAATVVDDIDQAFAFVVGTMDTERINDPRIVISPIWWSDDVGGHRRFECSIEGPQEQTQ